MRHYDLPPLDQLEAFEASARHLSFTTAADELALTQSAVKVVKVHFYPQHSACLAVLVVFR